MAHQSKNLLLAWKSINESTSSSGWQAINLQTIGSIKIQAGKRFPENLEAVLFAFPSTNISNADQLPEGLGFNIERIPSSELGTTELALSRKPAGNIELFGAMALDVISAVEKAAEDVPPTNTLLRLFLQRVKSWQAFMSKGSSPLSADGEVGLAGELNVLSRLIDEGVPIQTVINGWTGPTEDGVRDFSLNTGGIETKATMSSKGFVAKIGSLDQLDDSNCNPLFVAAIRFALSDNGDTLPNLIVKLRSKFSEDALATIDFENRLIAAGYIQAHDSYYRRKFLLSEEHYLFVDNNFPRLTIGNVNAGVIAARYDISLEHLLQTSVDIRQVLTDLGLH